MRSIMTNVTSKNKRLNLRGTTLVSFRVQDISQPVAEEVEGEDGEKDGERGPEGDLEAGI